VSSDSVKNATVYMPLDKEAVSAWTLLPRN